MAYKLDAACLCNTGRVRKNNEDNFYFDGKRMEAENNGLPNPLVMTKKLNQGVCVAVFDGMGGENFGEFASFAAADCMQAMMLKLQSSLSPDRNALNKMCLAINDAVVARQRELCTERMGSTLVGFYFSHSSVYAYNLGDSRAYRLRGGQIVQLSEDHVERREGKSTRKAPLTQHLGIDPEEYLIEPYIVKDQLQAGDQFLLCSDGLTDMLDDGEIAAIMTQAPSAEIGAKMLVNTALEHGGRDNVTVILCRIQETGEEDAPAAMGAMPHARQAAAPAAAQNGLQKRKRLVIGALIVTAALVLLLLVCFFTIHSWRPASCEEPETCSICGKTRGEALGHNWQPASCETPETCSVCGETRGSAPGHNWVEATCTEPKTCLVCGATEGVALGHDWEPATFTRAGVCRRCGERQEPIAYEGVPYTELRVKEGAEAAAANPAIDYSLKSETETELELPKNGEFFDLPMLMDSTGFDILPIPEEGHGKLGRVEHDETVLVVARRLIPTGPDGTDEAELYYFFVTYNGRAGWYKNEAFKVTGDAIGCQDGHHWEDATCVAPQVCSICGATQGELGEHVWQPATCTEPKTCSACGKTEGDALGHKWIDATCEDPEKCERCGTERLGGKPATGHKWKDATCTEPEICENCGKEKPGGKALGHELVAGTPVPPTCTEDGYTPYACSRCEYVEKREMKAKLGHDYEKGETVPPTCTEQGYTPYTCSRCGEVDKRDIVERLKHDWQQKVDGIMSWHWECSRCGAKDYGFDKPPASIVIIAEK